MLLAHRDEEGEIDQEVALDWGHSGAIILVVREATDTYERNVEGLPKLRAVEAVLAPDDCRALAANLVAMADEG